jgi:hypothetical protein
MMKRLSLILLVALSLALAGFAQAQNLSQEVTLDGYTLRIPADWVGETIDGSGVGVASDAALFDAVNSSEPNAEIDPGQTAILITGMEDIGMIAGEADSAREVLEIFVGFLDEGAEIEEVEGLPNETVVAEVAFEGLPTGNALIYALDLENTFALAIVVSGDDLGDVRGLAEDILATLTYEIPPRPEVVGVLELGDSADGEITDDAETLTWTFEAEANDVISISVVAPENSDLDSTVALYTLDDYNAFAPYLDYNDDSLSAAVTGRNSLLNGITLDEAGTYVIEVGSFGSTRGEFTVSLNEGELDTSTTSTTATTTSADVEPAEIAYGDTVTGEINDERVSAQYWVFTGEEGDIVTITMIAEDMNELDARLYLYAEGNVSAFDILAENDDAEDDSIGRLNSQIVEFELPADGNYVIEATQFGFGAGGYTLTLEEGSGASK